GRYLSGKPNEIIMGEKLVGKLGVRLHGKVVLTFQSVNGDLTAGSFRIAGIFRSRNSGFDESTVFTGFNDLGQLLGTGAAVHEIAIVLKDDRLAGTMAKRIQLQNPGLLVQTWSALSPEMALLNGIFDQYLYIVMAIILLALLFGIINTMLMAVLERQREFGMLLAIGMNKPRVFLMILIESVLLACAGIPAGILLTIGAIEWLARKGIDLSAFSQGLMQYGFSNRVYPVLEASMFLPVTIMTAITAVLSALYPAYKALSFKPAEAIRKI
ncbi:MAG TPA: FtsX-like permease family protein, partial [Puia sp.]|nr:FtsX-like permease family protein [Puia sp.]